MDSMNNSCRIREVITGLFWSPIACCVASREESYAIVE